MQVEPVFSPDSQDSFLCNLAVQGEADAHWVRKPRLDTGHWPLEIAGWKILFLGGDTNNFVIEYDGGAWRG